MARGKVRMNILGMKTRTSSIELRIYIELVYDVKEPHVITAHFTIPGSRPVTWEFDRTLLVDAAEKGKAGDGDVRFRRSTLSDRELELFLESDTGAISMRVDKPPLHSFVNQMLALMPLGSEPSPKFRKQRWWTRRKK